MNNYDLEIINKEEIIDVSKFKKDELKFKISAEPQYFLKIVNLGATKSIHFDVEEYIDVTINIIATDMNEDVKFTATVNEGSKLDINYVDFSIGNSKISAKLTLFGRNSQSSWNLSALSTNKNRKRFEISFDHVGEGSKSIMNNYGVAAEESTLLFEGCSHVQKPASKANASQTAKIIIYDQSCRAMANPVLKIDNNDIIANHAACVGTLNEEHVFYLLSRGIDIKNARKLITLGYLTSIFKAFNDEDQKYLDNILGERI